MGYGYGSGVEGLVNQVGGERDTAMLELLRALRSTTQSTLRDVRSDGSVIELGERGTLRTVECERATVQRAAMARSGGHLRYGSLGALLDGYHVLVPGAPAQAIRCSVGGLQLSVRGSEHLLAELDSALSADDLAPGMDELERELHEEVRRALVISIEHGFVFVFDA